MVDKKQFYGTVWLWLLHWGGFGTAVTSKQGYSRSPVSEVAHYYD